MGIIEDTKNRVDNYLSMIGVFQSSPGSAVGTNQENYEGQDLTSSLMSTDIWIQSQMEDAAKGTGIGTVGGQTHMPGQGAGEIGVVGAVSHAPTSGHAMLPSERALQLQQVAAVLDTQYQSGQIDQATYQAYQAQVIAEAGQLARYPSVANMYPVQGQQTKFQAAMEAAQGQVAAYRAAKESGQSMATVQLGGDLAQRIVSTPVSAPVASSVVNAPTRSVTPAAGSTANFLSAMANAAKNIAGIINKTTATPTVSSQVKPTYDIEQLAASLDAKRSMQQNVITLPGISLNTVKTSTISANAANAAKLQLSNNSTINSVVGISAATKAPVIIPITQQALSNIALANKITPNIVASPIVSNQVQAQVGLVSKVSTLQALANNIKTNVAQPITRTITFAQASPSASSSRGSNASGGGGVSYSGGVAYIGSSGGGSGGSSGGGRSSGGGGSSGAVTYSGGVAYIGSVGRGK
ncbi:hypothetical protein M0R72_06110 [Candidatus Pacearchaeota archaeon]|jgi:hypothetical protein|nr:hypothetical protein [Candidatus Pacearchaeota archaeon]